MTLTQYARQVHASNFICGLGRHCLAGQPCLPVKKLDWLILFSVQQWNFYMNSLYGAIDTAINIVRDVAAAAVNDFTPIDAVTWMGLTISVGVLATIVLATASVLLVGGPLEAGASAALAEAATAAEETVAGSAAAASSPKLVRRHHKETLSTDKFSDYAKLNNDISILHMKLNQVIYLNFNAVLSSPISSEFGIFNIVKNGTYLQQNPPRAILEEKAQKLAQLTMISELFKSLKMFILVEKGPCDSNDNDQKLEYCNEGLSMKIVRSDGDKLKREIPNAKLLSTKYGFDTKYLIETAWGCQQKTGNSRTNSKDKENKKIASFNENQINGDCAFTLPVCDTRLPDIEKEIGAHVDVVIACRESGHLDI